RQRAVVADLVEGADDRLPVDAAVPRRPVVPTPPRVAVGQVRPQEAAAPVQRQRRVLDVDVVNAVREAAHELRRVDPLPVQVAGVEQQAELLPAVQGVEYHLGRVQVEGDLPRVDLEGEL